MDIPPWVDLVGTRRRPSGRRLYRFTDTQPNCHIHQIDRFCAMNINGKNMISHQCQECAYSVSLGWAEPESALVFCIHPQMGHIGNWVQRIVNAEDKACAHFQEQTEPSKTQ